jgi:hypothetical protein
MVGRPSQQNPLISQLTLPPETITSCYPGIRHTEFQPHSGRHHAASQRPSKTSRWSSIFCSVRKTAPSASWFRRKPPNLKHLHSITGYLRIGDRRQSPTVRFARPFVKYGTSRLPSLRKTLELWEWQYDFSRSRGIRLSRTGVRPANFEGR